MIYRKNNKPVFPSLAGWVLKRLVGDLEAPSLGDDFGQVYEILQQEHVKTVACFLFWIQFIISLPTNSYWQFDCLMPAEFWGELGAPVARLVVWQTEEFSRWVLLANVLAWPLAWLVMNSWLNGFAHRVSLSWWIFVGAGSTALVVALATVSCLSLKAALANPVESLRSE